MSHILHTVADNIIDDLLELFRICHNAGICRCQVGIIQLDILLFQIKPDFLHAILEIICYVQYVEMIWYLIGVDT